MFLTPAQKPFFGGTCFPKTSRYGLPGVLNKPVDATVNAYLCRGVICVASIRHVQALLANLDTG
jgi:uncharacterized protein YyaL (SSP411 family)